jgi:hypothetical protein
MNDSRLALIRQFPDRFFSEFYRQADVEPTAERLAATRQYLEAWTDDEVRTFLGEFVENWKLPSDLPDQLADALVPLSAPPPPEEVIEPEPAALTESTHGPEVPRLRPPTGYPVASEAARPSSVGAEAPPVPPPAPFPKPPVPTALPRRRLVGAGAAGVGVAVLVAAGLWWLGRSPAGEPYVSITNAMVRERPETRAPQTATLTRAQPLAATGERTGRWVEILLEGEGILNWRDRRAWVDSQFVMRKADFAVLERVLPNGGTGLTSQHYWALRRYAAPDGGTREQYRMESLPGEAAQAGLSRYLTTNFTGRGFQDPNLRRNRTKNRNLIVLFETRGESTQRLVVFEFDAAANRYGRVAYEEDVEPDLALKMEPGGGFSLRDFSGNSRWLYRHEDGQVLREAANLTELLGDSEAD